MKVRHIIFLTSDLRLDFNIFFQQDKLINDFLGSKLSSSSHLEYQRLILIISYGKVSYYFVQMTSFLPVFIINF